MKKILLIPLMLLTLMSMAACGDSDEDGLDSGQSEDLGGNDSDGSIVPTDSTSGGGRYLVLYCSRTSNTERMAQQIQATLGCDILEVEPAIPYDNDYNAMLSRAQTELAAIRQGNYPVVKTTIVNFDKYDLVFIGYPIWFGSMATPMQTFLREHASELANKRIALFATSGSSGISTSVNEARALCSGSSFTETLLLTSSTLSGMESRIATWFEALGVSREDNNNSSMKLNITVGSRTITATMEDNAATRDFLSRLPLEVTLNDYNNGTEKIFYPLPELTTEGVIRSCTPAPGDLTIYVPWGNVAIFCKSWSASNDLIKLGHIDSDGIGALNVVGAVAVKFERP